MDWFSLQNVDSLVFPPIREVSSAIWEDVNAPVGALHLGTVRAVSTLTNDTILLAATDTGGVGIKYVDAGLPWQTLNGGYGAPGIRWPTIWDVAGVEFDTYEDEVEIFALGGNPYGTEVVGGLWYSSDSGTNWELLASSLYDGISMAGRESDCASASDSDAENGSRASGQFLVPDVETAQLWIASNHHHQTYDLDGDFATFEEEYDVHLYDEDEGLCSGTVSALPDGQRIGALARASMAISANGFEETPALVVGYRASFGGLNSLYVCDLPSTDGVPDLSCGDLSSISCAMVPGSGGIDVKDLEVDPLDPTIVYVADGGDDPDVPDDGVAPKECAAFNGGRVWVLDLVGAPFLAEVTDPAWPGVSAGVTGVSMDPGGEFLFAFLQGDNAIFRMDRPSVLAGSTTDWQRVIEPNDAVDAATRQVDHAANVDYSGGWYENDDMVVPMPFPEIYAPTGALDAIWYVDHTESPYGLHALVGGLEDMWDVVGLDDTNPWFNAEQDTYWTVWPEPDVWLPHDFQTAGAYDIALDHEQNLWAAIADKGLYVVPAPSMKEIGLVDNAVERDCLMELTDAGGNSVSVGLDGSVWGTLFQQGSGGAAPTVPHRIYVMRVLHDDYGDSLPAADDENEPDGDGSEWTWTYQGAGVGNLNSRFDVTDKNWLRCRNYDDSEDPRHNETIDSHYAVPMDGNGGGFDFTRDPYTLNGGLPGPHTPLASWGNPYSIAALDQNIAAVAFGSYTNLPAPGVINGVEYTRETAPRYDEDGSLAYTLDGGASWTKLAVASGPYVGAQPPRTASCTDSHTFFSGIQNISVVGAGTDSRWKDVGAADGVFDPATDDWRLTLLIASNKLTGCNLARVVIDPSGASWEWYELPTYNFYDLTTPCRIPGNMVRGVAASPWSHMAYVWGSYGVNRVNSSYGQYGGACSVNLDDGSIGVIVSPVDAIGTYNLDITEVVPHPNVVGTLLMSTSISTISSVHCAYWAIDWGVYNPFADAYCPTVAPALIASGGVGNWNIVQVPGIPAALTGSDAEWAPLAAGGGNDETVFYYTSVTSTWKTTIAW